jgi:DNA repair exonuclease SbcCD ATPase subunit
LALSGELYEAVIRIVDQRVGEIKVAREDFDRLTKTVSQLSGIVSELAEVQKRTESTISTLTEKVIRLEGAVETLAEAQKQTEERVNELAEAQKRTEERVSELAEAQRRTEDVVGRLAVAVGSLSDTVGYSLEDVARVMLPPWLERHERVKVEELERRFIEVDGESLEINLYGEGLKARTPVTVVGEAKSRIHVGDVKEFAGKVKKIQRALKQRRILPLMFGHWIHPSATSFGKTLHIRLVASYQR